MVCQGTQCCCRCSHCTPEGTFHFPSLAKGPSDNPTRLSYTQCCLWPFSPIFPCKWNLQRATLEGSEWKPMSGWLGHEDMRGAAGCRRAAIQLQSCTVFTSLRASMSGGSAQPFCKWSHGVPVRMAEKNMDSDRPGWAGCWWVAGVGWGQLVAAQPPPSCSLTFPQRDGGESWKAKSEKNSWVKMKAV